jgi:hypothetical protein
MAKRYDKETWDLIQAEYRAGALSVRELAKKYGPTEAAIRSRARKGDNGKPWERDLTDEVRAATRAKLNQAVAGPGAAPSEIIEAASKRNFETLQAHMGRLGKLAEVEEKIIDRIEQSFADFDRVAEAEDIATRLEMAMAEENPKFRMSAIASLFAPEEQRAGLLRTLSRCYGDLTSAAAKRIQLERQALNMDKPEEKDASTGAWSFEAILTGEPCGAEASDG